MTVSAPVPSRFSFVMMSNVFRKGWLLLALQRARSAHARPEHRWETDTDVQLFDFLRTRLPHLSRNAVKHLLARGQVSVEGKPTTRFDCLCPAGTSVRIGAPLPKRNDVALPILFEDADLLVVNKPAGLLSMASDAEKTRTAYHWLRDELAARDPDARLFIVHRLDRDTSGLLLFAKNAQMKRLLQDNWSQLVKIRGYAAVVEGKLNPPDGQVKSWLKETKTHLVYSSRRSGDGTEAITDYQTVRFGSGYTLVDIRLQTGRKNQIRVHMHDLGHSVVGDKQYGAKGNPLGRLGLHAQVLSFVHPSTGETLRFEASPPGSFARLLEGTSRTATAHNPK